MRYVKFVLVSFLIVYIAGCVRKTNPEPSPPSPLLEGDVSSSINPTALTIYSHLADENPGENIFFSPTSISLALTMTTAGAGGETLEEMRSVLHLPDDLQQTHAAYESRLENWNFPRDDYKLRVANRLWIRENFPLKTDFLDLTKNYYHAPASELDFGGDPEASRQLINDWVKEQTEDEIRDLLPSGSITDLTIVALTNAVYFRGDWKTQFSKDATRDEPFFLLDGETDTIPLMFIDEEFGYAKIDGAQVAALPYKGDDLEMLLFVPDKKDGLPELEENLSVEWINDAAKSLRDYEIELYLPRFEMEESFDLNETLQTLGMPRAFSPDDADFSDLTDASEGPVYISSVVHKAMIEVNEEGTVAAAATSVAVDTEAAMEIPLIRADHPFLFIIRDRRDGCILFLGRMMNP